MRISNLLFKSHKEKNEDQMGNNIIRGCFVLQESSGIYQYLPLGVKIIENLKILIRKIFEQNGLQEVMLPILQDMKLWEESGRSNIYGPEMFKLKNRENKEYCLAPTAEESVVHMAKNFLISYRNLPCILYQMSYKYRDEMRPRYCLIRNKEFIMMDAYSFDMNEVSSCISYMKMYTLYCEIFKKLNIDFVFSVADCGEVGGNFSQNAFIRSDMGEDELCLNIPWEEYKEYVLNCKNYEDVKNLKKYIDSNGKFKYSVVEVGHIFNLGTKYSGSMNGTFIDDKNVQQYYHMGCYGIGISRLLQVLFENRCLPSCISPYKFHLICINNPLGEEFYSLCNDKNISILFDDRDCGPGSKFNDADLINIPYQIIIGRHLEFFNRLSKQKIKFNDLKDLYEYISSLT